MSSLPKSGLPRWGVPLLCVAAATGLTFAVEPVFGGKAPMIFFIAAVVASALYGLGPGLLATALSLASALLLFPRISLVFANYSLTLFTATGVGISLVMARMVRINRNLLAAKQELEAANRQLVERGQALSRSNEELQRFAYTVAHDLNNPVRSIGALTELLVRRNRGRFDQSSEECAGLIVGKAHRMQAMIAGPLAYAAAVERSDERTLVDAGAAVQKALQDLDSSISARGARIRQDPLPAVIAGESQLVLVFSNLIGNAVKYCPAERRPEVRISAQEQADEYVFCIADNGFGLDMAHAEEIFGMFKRLHGEDYEGSGIGLALCKAVIERQGGRIWVESQEGQGAKFCFTLPR